MSNYVMNVSTAVNIASIRIKLAWAQRNLDERTFAKIEKSYKDAVKYTIIVVVALMLTYFAAVMGAQGLHSAARTGYDHRQGQVSGDTVWYVANEKYDLNLSDYGYNPADFSNGEYFRIYLDSDKNVVEIVPDSEVNKPLEDGGIVLTVMLAGFVVILVVILCIHLPVMNSTYGKIWKTYGKWYGKADLTKDRFVLE